MAQRTVRPELVKGLADWATRWGKVTNLGFAPETREPTVYSADSKRDPVKTFPWNREADTMTILSQPGRFSAPAREAARDRYQRVQEQYAQERATGEKDLAVAEARLLETWRTYYAAVPEERGPLRQSVISAERIVREIEHGIAARVYPERKTYGLGDYTAVYNPPIPTQRRGIPLVAVGAGAGAGAAAVVEAVADAVSSAVLAL
jgi:hypothetical protein